MTELEWFTSNDVKAMLEQTLISDHKLRMWVQACRAWYGCSKIVYDINTQDGLTSAIADWSFSDGFSDDRRISFIRDIVGNPRKKIDAIPRHEQIFVLADAAYNIQPGQDCSYCDGRGVNRNVRDDVSMCLACRSSHHANCFGKAAYFESICSCNECWKCQVCDGTGHYNNGLLDSVRLAILADALEEVGYGDEDALMHLRGKRKCVNTLQGRNPVGKLICSSSCGCGGSGWVTCNAPHVQGCYVLDAILGKS